MRLQMLSRRIVWLVNAAVVLLIVLVVTLCLSLILESAGDSSGAAAVRGLLYVGLSLFVVDVLALLGCLATATVGLIEQSQSNSKESSPETSAHSDTVESGTATSENE